MRYLRKKRQRRCRIWRELFVNMNRTQKFALNSLTAAISQLVVMIVGFITPRLMISTYGSEVNGLVSSLNQFISYISLVEAGIGGAAIYSLYKPLANKDQKGISSIFVAAKKSYTQAGYIFSSGIFILAIVYALVCSTETLTFGTIFPLAILLGVNGCVNFFFVSGYRVLLTADQKNYILSSMAIIQTVLRTVIICLLAFFEINVIILYAVAATPVILKCIIIYLYSKKSYPYIDKKAPADHNSLNKRWDVIYQQILGTVQTGAPTVIATIILDFLQVSVYSIYNMVMAGINGILSIFITGLPAGFGELIAKGEKDNLRKTVSEFEVAYYYILSVIYGVTMVMILPFVSVYTNGLTDVNYYSPVLAVFVVLNGLLYNIKTPQSMLIISAGMYKETRWRVTIQGVLIIVAGIAIGAFWGLPGIVLGSCISNLYRTIDLLFFVPKRITHNKGYISVLRMIRVILNIVIICIPSLILKVSVNGYFEWICYAIFYTIYAGVVVTLTTIIFDRKEFISLVQRFKNMLFRG